MRIDRLAAPLLIETWSLREDTQMDVRTSVDPTGRALRLTCGWGQLVVSDPSPALREALRRMLLGPVSLGNVLPGFPGYDSELDRCSPEALELLRDLTRLQSLVCRTLMMGAISLVTVVPLSRRATFAPRPLPGGGAGGRVKLSSSVRLRYTGSDQQMHLESEHSDHWVQLHSPEAAWLVGGLEGSVPEPLRMISRLRPLALPDVVAEAGLAYLLATRMASLPSELEREPQHC